MLKYVLMVILASGLIGCSSEDEQYYRNNPRALQLAVKNCPSQNNSSLSCEQLSNLVLDTNKLAFELQMEPQKFGNKILALQKTISLGQEALKAKPNLALQNTIEKKQQELKERLAIVRWLESPEG